MRIKMSDEERKAKNKEYARLYKINNPEKYKASEKKHSEHKKAIKEYVYKKHKEWRDANKEKIQGYNKDFELKYATRRKNQFQTKRFTMYGMTKEEFTSNLSLQDNKCAICFVEFSDKIKPCVDHKHGCCKARYACNKCRRGLLCLECNFGLGKFKDNKASLFRAINYLQSYENKGLI